MSRLEQEEEVQTIRILANGINFEVFAQGMGNKFAICLHGFPEDAHCWRHQLPFLTELGFRVWAPNLRGYGATDSPRDVASYRMDLLVRDAADLIRAAGASKALVVGHDWGGAVAWTLAARMPELVERLVIINAPHPACFLREFKRLPQLAKSWYMLFFQLPTLPEWILTWGNASVIANLLRRTSANDSVFPGHVLDRYRRNGLRPGGMTAMLNWYRAMIRGRVAAKVKNRGFPMIQAPTLLIWGDADRFSSLRTTFGTDRYVANLTFRLLPGVSHWAQEEAPEAVNNLIEAWLLGHVSP